MLKCLFFPAVFQPICLCRFAPCATAQFSLKTVRERSSAMLAAT
jgi:hypothetical protein